MSSRDQALAAIVDAFVPAPEGLPSASELGVHRRLLAEVDALNRPSLRQQLDLLLRVADSGLGNLLLSGRPKAVSAMDQAAREAWLRSLADSPIALKRTAFQDLKRLTLLLAYGIEDSPWRARTGFVAPTPDAPSPSEVRVRTPKPGEVVEADVVVIGSGAGGGVAAAVLAAAGRKVVVLERAAMVAEGAFGGPELDGLAALFLDRGLSATTDRWIAIRAGSAVGGGTVVNWSSSLRAPDAVREEWRAAGVGDDLDEHYDAVEQALGVTTDESERNGPNGRLAAGLEALGLPWQTIPRNVRGCGDCGPCAVGCRRGAKQSVLRTFLAEACADGAEVLDRCEAVRILLEGGRAAGVVAEVPGGEITVRAPLVALAGGSLLSPVVLLRSGIASATAGRTLHVHPVAAVAGVYDDSLSPWSGVPQSVMSDVFGEVDGTWGFRMEAAPTHPGLIASGFPWWDSAAHREVMTQCDHVAAFLAHRPRPQRRADLDRPRWRHEHRVPAWGAGAGAAPACVRGAGAGPPGGWRPPRHPARDAAPCLARRPALRPWLEALGRRSVSANRILLFTAHQMSSCRIGTDPRSSVADPDGPVHGTPGVWVTDASAMPTASGVNPMLSLMALARRTATRMAAAE